MAIKLALGFDPAPLAAELKLIAETEWKPHFNRETYSGVWRVAALRSKGGGLERIEAHPTSSDDFADTPILSRCPAFARVVHGFNCPTTAVRLFSLSPGAVVREHRDRGLRLEDGEARLHIPVQSNREVEFVLGGERLQMSVGECWYINADLPHSVVNRGSTERVHLVIDCLVDDWLLGLMPAAGVRRPAREQTGGVDAANWRQVVQALRLQDTATARSLADRIEGRWKSR
jgi:quercetin dioxygenase-like cupin family protein